MKQALNQLSRQQLVYKNQSKLYVVAPAARKKAIKLETLIKRAGNAPLLRASEERC
jgi:hypothetical protein